MANDGSYLQDELQKVLKDYMRFNRGFYYRFYDTKSAGGGNFLPAQPGDFFLLIPEGCLLIECKSSEVGTPLLTMAHHGKVGKNQIAKHRMWHRAGHSSLYLYLDLRTHTVEWHLGSNVVNKKHNPVCAGPLKTISTSLHEALLHTGKHL